MTHYKGGQQALLVSLSLLLPLAVSSESIWAQDRDFKSASFNMPGCRALLGGGKRALTAAAGYCLGVIDGIVFNVGAICVPNGVSGKDEVAVVLEYVEARPDRQNERFAELAFEALQEKWPCKQ